LRVICFLVARVSLVVWIVFFVCLGVWGDLVDCLVASKV